MKIRRLSNSSSRRNYSHNRRRRRRSSTPSNHHRCCALRIPRIRKRASDRLIIISQCFTNIINILILDKHFRINLNIYKVCSSSSSSSLSINCRR